MRREKARKVGRAHVLVFLYVAHEMRWPAAASGGGCLWMAEEEGKRERERERKRKRRRWHISKGGGAAAHARRARPGSWARACCVARWMDGRLEKGEKKKRLCCCCCWRTHQQRKRESGKGRPCVKNPNAHPRRLRRTARGQADGRETGKVDRRERMSFEWPPPPRRVCVCGGGGRKERAKGSCKKSVLFHKRERGREGEAAAKRTGMNPLSRARSSSAGCCWCAPASKTRRVCNKRRYSKKWGTRAKEGCSGTHHRETRKRGGRVRGGASKRSLLRRRREAAVATRPRAVFFVG